MPKLRDSCHACASSKLKCSKEKPTCSRCAKRGLTCEYVATRRGGRKHDNKSSTSTSNGSKSPANTTPTDITNQPLPPLNNWFSSNSAITTTEALSSPGVIQHSISTTSAPSSTLFSDFDFPLDQPLTNGLDDFTTSPSSFSMPIATDADILSQAQFFNTDLDSSSNSSTNLFDTFPVFEDSISELFALSNPRSPPNSRASSSNDAQSQQILRATDSSCSCLIRALGLMKQFSSSAPAASTLSPIQVSTDPNALTSIKLVIAKNEHTMQALNSMLECSCSQDGYLLAIMSLIIFKVLGCYAGAASGKTPDSPHTLPSSGVQTPLTVHSRQSSQAELPTIANGPYLDSEDSSRMAAQLVLSELHRVQRFVNQLSTKLKARAVKMDAGSDFYGFENAESEMALPLSAVMLEQFEVDLRKRLRGLSMKIVERLRDR
ncbi:MAG: hypothetical protein Q9195_005026 [Heterodermia aff. obscurata]